VNRRETSVRREGPEDVEAVRRVHEEAFGQRDEAEVVNRLRAREKTVVSLVAVRDDLVVGHILFSRVTIASAPRAFKAVGLAPLGVLPAYQRQGAGTLLVRAGIEACRKAGYGCVVVLGHPQYYPRFGFVSASRYGLKCQWDAPEGAFMALALREGALEGCSGLVRYEAEFGGL
jgi:putative acetyltransferase